MEQEQRHAVDFPALFYRDGFQSHRPFGVGRVLNLSLQSCEIECQFTIEMGELLAIRLYVPGVHPQINIQSATVVDICNQNIELSFSSFQAGEEERLAQIIQTLKPKT